MNPYSKLAKETIENFVKNKTILAVPVGLPDNFYQNRSGVFVSIHKGKTLCDCIGTYLPTKNNLAEEIIANAVAACSSDYRFEPIKTTDLPDLNYEIYILKTPTLVLDIKKHDPKKHGVIVKTKDGRCGLLLPDLESVENSEKQILIASQKGGINPTKDEIILYEFEAKKYV